MSVLQRRRSAVIGMLVFTLGCAVPAGFGWAQLSSGRLRPFVTGLIPVVGSRGQVGGVLVDPKGSISVRARVAKDLQRIRQRSLQPLASDLKKPSKLRKISLRRLQQVILQRVSKGQPIGDDLQFLAGLQRVEYVFVDPEHKDIILAGPAEGWRVDKHGDFVGLKSGVPVLQLDDLVVALRSAKDVNSDTISCSIDPTAEGLKRLLSSLAGRRPPNLRKMQALLGPQKVTVKGVAASSHLARVLVAADVRMKRLALNLEKSPIAEMPSYLQLLQQNPPPSGAITPRWWLAPSYDPLERDELGLAWHLTGQGLKVLSADDRPGANREPEGKGPAEEWAASFTKQFPAIAGKISIFAKLRGVVDMAMAAAIIDTFELEEQAECDLSLLLNPKPMKVAEYPIARTIPTRASSVPSQRSRLVAFSGGVNIKLSAGIENVREVPSLKTVRGRHLAKSSRWWWD